MVWGGKRVGGGGKISNPTPTLPSPLLFVSLFPPKGISLGGMSFSVFDSEGFGFMGLATLSRMFAVAYQRACKLHPEKTSKAFMEWKKNQNSFFEVNRRVPELQMALKEYNLRLL